MTTEHADEMRLRLFLRVSEPRAEAWLDSTITWAGAAAIERVREGLRAAVWRRDFEGGPPVLGQVYEILADAEAAALAVAR